MLAIFSTETSEFNMLIEARFHDKCNLIEHECVQCFEKHVQRGVLSLSPNNMLISKVVKQKKNCKHQDINKSATFSILCSLFSSQNKEEKKTMFFFHFDKIAFINNFFFSR